MARSQEPWYNGTTARTKRGYHGCSRIKSTHVYPSFNNPTIHNTTPLHLTRQHDDMSQSIQNTIPISRMMAPRLFVASPFLSTMRMGRISRALPSTPWVPPRSLVGGVATIECWRWIGAAGPRSGPESKEDGEWIVAAGPRSGHESIGHDEFTVMGHDPRISPGLWRSVGIHGMGSTLCL